MKVDKERMEEILTGRLRVYMDIEEGKDEKDYQPYEGLALSDEEDLHEDDLDLA